MFLSVDGSRFRQVLASLPRFKAGIVALARLVPVLDIIHSFIPKGVSEQSKFHILLMVPTLHLLFSVFIFPKSHVPFDGTIATDTEPFGGTLVGL